jgi:hypothetical protein
MGDFPQFRVPDVLGEAVGWRAWRVVRNGEARLASVEVSPTPWHPGEFALARCLRGAPHSAPDESCSCGFYAATTREYLLSLGAYYRYEDVQPVVIGEVAMSGKVIPASRGYRAERARPLRLHVPYELWRLADELDGVYGRDGVRIELDNTLWLVSAGRDEIGGDLLEPVRYGQ